MAKTNAPLLSIGASGTIAKTQVYASWRGIPYVRRYVVPSNPRSPEQEETRGVFTYLNGLWKSMSADVQAPWTAFASGQKFVNRNAFLGKNVSALRAGMDLTGFIASPGSGGGPAPGTATYTGGSGAVTINLTTVTPPTGWTITSGSAIAIKNVDPHGNANFASKTTTVTTGYNAIAISGLAAGSYLVSVFLKYLKPDGSVAFSPAISGTATAT